VLCSNVLKSANTESTSGLYVAATAGSLTADLSNNQLTSHMDSNGAALYLSVSGSASATATISGNTISEAVYGIFVHAAGTGVSAVKLRRNSIDGVSAATADTGVVAELDGRQGAVLRLDASEQMVRTFAAGG
jgi:hypothetical protein